MFLALVTVMALVWANSPLSESYLSTASFWSPLVAK